MGGREVADCDSNGKGVHKEVVGELKATSLEEVVFMQRGFCEELERREMTRLREGMVMREVGIWDLMELGAAAGGCGDEDIEEASAMRVVYQNHCNFESILGI